MRARQPFELLQEAVVVGADGADERGQRSEEAPARPGGGAAGRWGGAPIIGLSAGGISPRAQAASAFCLMLSNSAASIAPSSSSFLADAIWSAGEELPATSCT